MAHGISLYGIPDIVLVQQNPCYGKIFDRILKKERFYRNQRRVANPHIPFLAFLY
jgi:hypothetical protein